MSTYHSGMPALPIVNFAEHAVAEHAVAAHAVAEHAGEKHVLAAHADEQPAAAAAAHAALAAALQSAGACLLHGFPDAAATLALREAALDLRRLGALAPAATGRGADRAFDPRVRGDSTLWLDDPRSGDAAAAHLQALDALRTPLNRALFLGLRSVEAHFAIYPPGSGYARHRDRFRGAGVHDRDSARVVSLVSYLNEDWAAGDGGALRLYTGQGSVDILPRGGTTVCFLSELEHEVLPARRERISIAAWFRRDG